MIRVLVPDMPSADELLPYLRRIDHARTYVNDGPLVRELTESLESICNVPVAVVSSGTAALELALQALDRRGDVVTLPALTFSATGLVALKRHTPCLRDVNRASWQMRPSDIPENFTLAVPVATFGKPVDTHLWESDKCDVVIDAAGALLTQQNSYHKRVMTCFSLHATKFIGAGEGGAVACADLTKIKRIRELASFGERGTNAKMSEYHAAVALASLARVRSKQKKAIAVCQWYARHGLDEFKHYSSSLGTLLTVELNEPIPLLANAMADRGVEVRRWYRPWLDERPEFLRPHLPNTDYLRHRLVGLPFHNFLTEADVAHVMASLREVTK